MKSEMGDAAQQILNQARPRLWKAYVAARGEHGADEAVSEALAWGWEHRDRLLTFDNPVGYLYRVGLTRTTRLIDRAATPTSGDLPEPAVLGLPHIEPGLIPALLALPEKQRGAVWLVHGCGWTHAEVAEALGVARTTVGTHVSRALTTLRHELEVTFHG